MSPLWGSRARLVAATTGVLAVVVSLQLLASHYNQRFDLTPEHRFTLSSHSRRVLAAVERPVRITAFVRSDDPRNQDLADLLWRMRRKSPWIETEVLDLNRNPGVSRRFGVDLYGAVVVESGARRKTVADPREETLISAIIAVTRPKLRIVYWLRGHGERDLADTDRRRGYSTAATVLRQEGYRVRVLDLARHGRVPVDAAVLVLAAPGKDLLPGERAAIERYLDRGGRLLVLVEPSAAPTVDLVLARAGIRAGSGVVVDPDNGLSAGEEVTIRVPEVARGHPATAVLEAPPVLSEARPLELMEREGAGRAMVLLRTGPRSWATREKAVLRTGQATFVAGRDRPGPLALAVAAALPARALPGASARVVAIGDADFANNFFIELLGNRDFLLNSINWLAGEEELIAARRPRKVPGREEFFLSRRQARRALWLAAIAEPLFFLALGAGLFARRRWHG